MECRFTVWCEAPYSAPHCSMRSSEAAALAQGHLELSAINLTCSARAFWLQEYSTTLLPPQNVAIWNLRLKNGKGKTKTFNDRHDQDEKHWGPTRCYGLFHYEINTRPFFEKWGWNHPWHPLLPTHINYFRICLVIQAENPTQNEWDVSFMQLLVKALQGVKSRVDLNWSQQYRIRSSGD